MASFAGEGRSALPGIQWQWLGDSPSGRGWVDYDSSSSALIESSYVGAASFVEIHPAVGGIASTVATYQIDFSTMMQINVGSGFLRNVRRNAGALNQISNQAPNQVPAAMGAAAAGGGGADDAPSNAEFQAVLRQATDYTEIVGADETCAVCIDVFNDQEPALLLSKCEGHYIHRECALKSFAAVGLKCPTCSAMYGSLYGDQPDGSMTVWFDLQGVVPLSGYESTGTITIEYNFPNGTQGQQHPNPGRPYHGTIRLAYLPDNADGNEVLQLLRKSFDQKLTFAVSTSITTGIPNCVVWNGVHHKTSPSGGSSMYGYPDPRYFLRVKAELAAKGIS